MNVFGMTQENWCTVSFFENNSMNVNCCQWRGNHPICVHSVIKAVLCLRSTVLVIYGRVVLFNISFLPCPTT